MNYDEPFDPEPKNGEVQVQTHRPLSTDVMIIATHEKGPGTQPGRFGRHPTKANKGRPPSYVRAASRQGYLRRIPLLRNIADGLIYRQVSVMNKGGEVVSYNVYPTIAERMKAVEILGKYGGLVTTVDADADDPEVPEVAGYDFSLLSTDQVQELQALLARARVVPE